MLPQRSVSTLLSLPNTMSSSTSKQVVNAIKSFTGSSSNHAHQFKQFFHTGRRNSTPSYSLPKSSSGRKMTGALLAFPAFALAADFIHEDDDKENECTNVLKCSTQSTRSLKESANFLTPIDFSVHDTRLCIGVSMVPHPAKRAKGGEDAYFISDDMRAIGIADGVGGWGDIGVDPALYARMMMVSAKYSADNTHPSCRDPVKIMTDGYERSMDVQGSSTCCVIVLDGFCLRTANLGDSGFMVIRGSEILFRTKEQQHSFNFPYQLGTGSADMPHHAVTITVNIQAGDLVIMGTDGLFDNLYDDEILDIATSTSDPGAIAQLIARHAHETAADKSVISPFAKAARENGYPLATGGKMDDISVVVAKVVLSSDGGSASFAA